MTSKTQLKERTRRKVNPSLVETINLARKNAKWHHIAFILSGPTRKHFSVNLDDINKKAGAGDTILVPGKILGVGHIEKKMKVCALGFSDSARAKLKEAKCEIMSIAEEISKNPKAEGIKVFA